MQFTPDGQWHEVVLRPTEIAGGEHWSGANDGEWHPPARLLAINISGTSGRDSKKPVLYVTDVSADVVLAALVKPAAFREDFEASADMPAGWQIQGDVAVVTDGPFEGERALALRRTEAQANRPAAAVGPSFDATPGTWEIAAACKSQLHSPDNSYNGTVSVEWLGAGDALIERADVALATGEENWKLFRRRLEAPEGARSARFRIQLNKTYGALRIDELSAAYVAPASPVAQRIDRVLLASGRLGNLLYPDDEPVIHMTVEALRPLPESWRHASFVVRDYWGAEQGPAGTVTLERTGRRAQHLLYEADLHLKGLPLELGRYYEVHVEIPREGAEPFRESTTFARLPEAAAKQYRPQEVPFTSRNWDNRIRDYFFLSDRLGIRVCGIWGGWSEKPPYKPSAPGLKWCQELHMGVLSHTPGSQIERNGFVQYDRASLREGARQFVGEYADDGLLFVTLGNEPHGDFEKTKENVAAYQELYKGVKQARPDFTVIGTAVGPAEDYFKAGFQDYQDVYDFHTYEDYRRIPRLFETYEELFAKYGGRKPICSTELGLNSQGMTRYAVATVLIKKLTLFFACGGEHCSWFTILYPDPDGKRRHSAAQAHNVFYCQYNMYSPKLDALAYYNIVNGICIKKFVQQRTYEDATEAYLFQDRDARCLQVLWNDQDRREVFVPLPGVRAVQTVRVDGGLGHLDASGEGITVDVSTEPILLLYSQPDASLAEKLGSPAISLASELRAAVKGETATLSLTGKDLSPETVAVAGPPEWKIAVEPAEGGVKCVVHVPPETAAREARVRLTVRETDAPDAELFFGVPIASRLAVALLPVPRTDEGLPGVKLVIRNNGPQPQEVGWTLSLTGAMPMTAGTFDLTSSARPDAFFASAPDGRASIDSGESKEIVTPLKNADPLTIYRAVAAVTDARGRTIECERLLAGFAGVPKARATVTLDGELSEADWQRAPVQLIADERQYQALRKDAGTWTGPQDLSAKVRFLWDAQYLYVGADVVDDVYCNPQANDALWSQDGLQFLVDPARGSTEKKGKYDYSAAVGQKGPQAWCHLSGDPGKAPAGEAQEIRVAAKRADERTGSITYELAIPWLRLSPFEPTAGSNLGLAMILNEDDGPGRDACMGWFSGVHSKALDMVGDLVLAD
jgi:hypothetical protein